MGGGIKDRNITVNPKNNQTIQKYSNMERRGDKELRGRENLSDRKRL